MKPQTFSGKKKDGKFHIWRRKEMQELLDSVEEGVELEIIIQKKKKKRSLPQNRYYHSCVIPAVYDGLVDIGYSKKELSYDIVHEYLKDKFLYTDVVNEDTGEVIKMPKGTSELSTSEMMDYIADIQQFASEFLGIYIPEPNQQSNLDL